MNIFEFILSPFIFIIKQLFLVSYNLSDNYGIAIILLSLAISALLLPVFIIIEKAKKKDDAVKLKMKSLIDEIKRCYKGQERYYYIKTLNRQHNYSPVRALIPILSLLLQIPFFIAAYQFLEGFEPLAGISFLFIADLSAPDALFGNINILPIAMTIVNLLTAYFYTRHGNTAERKQMLVVAGAFLILLFNLPAGLVLYWTLNNVFSFFRMFVTNPEVFKKVEKINDPSKFTLKGHYIRLKPLIPKLKRTFIVLAVVGILSQLNWAFQFNFDDIIIRIIGAVFGSAFATIVIALLSIFYNIETTLKKDNFKIVLTQIWVKFKYTFITITTVIILSQVNWAINHHFNDFAERLFFSIIAGLIVSYLIVFTAIAYKNQIFKNRINISLSSYGKKYKIIFAILSVSILISQVNWAIYHYFDDIILRLSIALLLSWLLVFLMGKSISALKENKLSFKYLFRLLIEKVKRLKWFYFTLSTIAIISQINWALQFNFDDIALRLIGAIVGSAVVTIIIVLLIPIYNKINSLWLGIKIPNKVFLLMFAASLYFYLAATFYFTGINEGLILIAIILVIPTQFIAINILNHLKTNTSSITHYLTLFLIICIAILQILNTYAFFSGEEISFVILNTTFSIKESSLSDIAYNGLIFSAVTILLLLKPAISALPGKLIKNHWTIYILSLSYLSGLIFLWYPLIVYSSSPESFSFSAISIIRNNFMLFLITVISLTILYSFITRKTKRLFLIAMITISAIAFFNVFIFPIDMGTLQMNRFSKINNLEISNSKIIVELIFLFVVIWYVNYIVKKNYSTPLIFALLILNIIPISQSIFKILLPEQNTNSVFYVEDNETNGYNLATKSNSSISFSKDNENVVIIMADMFQGWYIKNIMEENSKLKESFNGFVWYSNTLSVSNYTAGTMPAILAGHNFTPDKLDKDTIHTLAQKTVIANELFRDKIKAKGYTFTSTSVPYSKMDKTTIDTYLPLWHKDWNRLKNTLNIGNSRELSYTILWQNTLFFCAPNFIKSKIYNNGTWLLDEKKSKEDAKLSAHYNFIRALPYISDTLNKEPNFTLICTKASHFPWDIVDNDGMLHQNITPYENNKWTMEKIADWLNWMRQNNVYDNTKIILVSDHGIRDTEINDTIMIDNPFTPKAPKKISLRELLYYTPLLLVKDFNSIGIYSEDKRFMSNADVPSIAFDENNQTKINPPKQRTLDAFLISWRIKVSKNKKFPIDKTYKVKDNVYKTENWTVIEP